MGTTAKGLPYPEPTDPVAAGAGAIRALAEAVDVLSPRFLAAAIAGTQQGLGGLATLTATTINFTLATPRHVLFLGQAMIEKGANTGSNCELQIASNMGDPIISSIFTVPTNGWGQGVVFRYISCPAGAISAWLKAGTGTPAGTFGNVYDRALVAIDLGAAT